MQRTKWFERRFPLIEDNGLFPGIIERVEGTPARLYFKFKEFDGNQPQLITDTTWSIKKEIGHLTDLEPLWLERLHQLIAGLPELSATDLTNQKTHESRHDEKTIDELLIGFKHARNLFVDKLRSVTDADLEKKALHPRLKIQMRIIDLTNFVAEHDDHHLSQITFLLNHPSV